MLRNLIFSRPKTDMKYVKRQDNVTGQRFGGFRDNNTQHNSATRTNTNYTIQIDDPHLDNVIFTINS